jgi:hypothetical protein
LAAASLLLEFSCFLRSSLALLTLLVDSHSRL